MILNDNAAARYILANDHFERYEDILRIILVSKYILRGQPMPNVRFVEIISSYQYSRNNIPLCWGNRITGKVDKMLIVGIKAIKQLQTVIKQL